MHFYKVTVAFLLFLPMTLYAQRNIRAFEARDSIGKNVSVMAHVVNVTVNPQTKIVNIGLSDWRNKEELLTLLIHLKKISKANKEYFFGLKGQTITFKGKVEKIDGKTVINSTEDNIQQVITVDQF